MPVVFGRPKLLVVSVYKQPLSCTLETPKGLIVFGKEKERKKTEEVKRANSLEIWHKCAQV